MRSVVVVHLTTGERRSLELMRAGAREIELRWPLLGALRFHCKNGKGIAKAKDWCISPVSMVALHKELGISPLEYGPIDDAQRRIAS